MARAGQLSRAAQLADFLDTRLRDPDSGLIFDGLHAPGGQVNRALLAYCQGVAIGLEAEFNLLCVRDLSMQLSEGCCSKRITSPQPQGTDIGHHAVHDELALPRRRRHWYTPGLPVTPSRG